MSRGFGTACHFSAVSVGSTPGGAAKARRGPARCPAGGPAGPLALSHYQAAPQLHNRLGVNLAHPALGDAQDLPDLGQG